MRRFPKSRKGLLQLKTDLEQAIELTEVFMDNCTIPSLKNLHCQAIGRYKVKLSKVEEKLALLPSSKLK